MPEIEITYRQYREELDSIVDSVLNRCEETGEDREDVVLEYTDSHQWVIYYWAHQYVMEHTDNEDEALDVYGDIPVDSQTGWLGVRAFFACWAFRADVVSLMWQRADEREEEQ